MVRYNQAYYGTTNIGYISKNGKIVKKIYKGSTLVYKLGFDTFTVNAGTSLRAWKVPMGVEKIHIDCVASRGAHGQAGHSDTGSNLSNGGNGGRVQCDMKVNGGETLYITVGNIPSNQQNASYNASDIRIGGTGYANRVLVAGGGGSGCYNSGDSSRTAVSAGANGGGTTGANSADAVRRTTAGGAKGGTQSAGGAGGVANTSTYNGGNGTLGMGGAGKKYWAYSGAGGAGYYGGGGGASSAGQHSGNRYRAASGGAGGSSYANSSRCSSVTHTQGYRNGAGYVTISYVW